MDTRSEVRDFITSRRAKITPEQVGLPARGARQVPGLRREEVATLAGISVDYYNRMERGNLAGVSRSVLEAVAGALRLDEAERAHLFDLARASNTQATGKRRRPATSAVRPSIAWMADAMTGAAAFVANSRQDILAANHLGRAFFTHLFEAPAPRTANMARYTYLDPRAKDFFADWNRTARECVAALRTQLGHDPFNRDLSDLVGELSTQCEEFAAFWAAHEVRLHNRTEKDFNHPLVGELTLRYERLAVTADPDLQIYVYVPEPGSRSEQAFAFLASYTAGHSATPDRTPTERDT